MLSAQVRQTLGRQAAALAQRRFLSIPVNHIVRGAEFKVEDEAMAEKADAVSASVDSKLKQAMGSDYVGYNRLVCKAAWDYKVYYEFKDPQAFGAFMEKHVGIFDKGVEELNGIAKNPVHTQNYVFDAKQ